MPVPLAGSNSRACSKCVVNRLTGALLAKQQELNDLQQEHNRLAYQHKLLVALCDSLNWLRCQGHLHKDAELLAAAASELATEEELQLLQQLRDTPYSTEFMLDMASPNSTRQQQEQQQDGSSADTEPIAPPHDMLHLFHRPVVLPALPSMDNLSLTDLQISYMSTVRELSLQLCLHKSWPNSTQTTCIGHSRPVDQMAAILTRHLHLLASLSLAQRGDLISAFLLSNCETGELVSAVCAEQHRMVLPHLNLTQQQQDKIAAGIPVFKRLLAPVVQELKQLQQQELGGGSVCNNARGDETSDTAAAAAGSLSDSRSVDTSSAGSAAAAAAANAAEVQYDVDTAADLGMPAPFTDAKVLSQQQRRARRLGMLLQKEYLLRSYASCFVYGNMSWVQVATLSVLLSPFPPAPAVLVQEILEAAESQPQQQQGSQPRQQKQKQNQQASKLQQQQQQQQHVKPGGSSKNALGRPPLPLRPRPSLLRGSSAHQSTGNMLRMGSGAVQSSWVAHQKISPSGAQSTEQ